MGTLSNMPNIGTTLEEKLMQVEIKDADDLKNIGSKEAFIKLKLVDPTACFNTLCALEGAIEDIRWHHLSQEKKSDLKTFFDTLK